MSRLLFTLLIYIRKARNNGRSHGADPIEGGGGDGGGGGGDWGGDTVLIVGLAQGTHN